LYWLCDPSDLWIEASEGLDVQAFGWTPHEFFFALGQEDPLLLASIKAGEHSLHLAFSDELLT